MTDMIWEIHQQTPLNESEIQELTQLMLSIGQKCKDINLHLSPERWMAIGIHLVNMLRRIETQEQIPEIKESMWAQISPEIKLICRNILETYSRLFDQQQFIGEVFLLAVHFETAKLLDNEE